MKTRIFSALFGFILLGSPLAQAKNGFYPTRFTHDDLVLQEAKAAGGGKLAYYGGPVISNAKVYVVFWGNGVVSDIKANIAPFYEAVTNSTYFDWLEEYNTTGKSLDGRDGTNQHIGRGKYLGTVTITPNHTGTKIDDEDIQAELQQQIDAQKLPTPDDDTLFMIYFPPGYTITAAGMASCSAFCAYHGYKGDPKSAHFYYGVMPDLGGACSFGCGFSGHMNLVTSISAHELVEAVTDPFPTPGSDPAYPQAWNDSQGYEIADKCAGSDNTLTAVASGRTFAVTSEWSNKSNGCTRSNWTAP